MKNTSVLPAHYLPAKRDFMPVITAAASIPVVATFVWTYVLAIVARQPEIGDLYAIVGAGMGSICVLVEARARARSLYETLSAFIGSGAVGSFGPAIVYALLRWKGILSDDFEKIVTWHFWSAAGFVAAMNGWLVIHQVNKRVRKWLDDRSTKRMQGRIRIDDDFFA